MYLVWEIRLRHVVGFVNYWATFNHVLNNNYSIWNGLGLCLHWIIGWIDRIVTHFVWRPLIFEWHTITPVTCVNGTLNLLYVFYDVKYGTGFMSSLLNWPLFHGLLHQLFYYKIAPKTGQRLANFFMWPCHRFIFLITC